jgi:hypothetical protein
MGDRPLPLLLGEESELESGARLFREAQRTAQFQTTVPSPNEAKRSLN